VRPAAAALALALAVVVLAGCGGGDKPSEELPKAPATVTLTSPAFHDGATIPTRYTCSGAGGSPPLAIAGVPRAARELALVVEDPDAGRFVHWSVLGIAPGTTAIRAGAAPPGSVEPKNSFGDPGWGAPCPPEGDAPHHYVFALYALDSKLALGADASPDDVRSALAGHALARGTLTGRFGR
jgi:Raf kinase inhibitor-like YbhB/YbcL family protein